MSEALVKFDRFIIANAPVSEAMLAAEKQAFLQKRQDEFEAMTPNDRKANCDKNPYTQVFNDPPRRDLFLKILASTDEFLAVPRKPTMNPCF